jgi:uncharacterized protein (DUF362 family)
MDVHMNKILSQIESDISDSQKLTRRKFVKDSAAGLIATGFGLGLFNSGKSALAQERAPRTKSRVAQVVNPDAWQNFEAKKFNIEVLREMTQKGMMALTDKKSPAEAWKEFFAENDVVGIKVNPIAGPELSTHRELVDLLIEGLKSAGVKEGNIIIWDRFEADLIQCGYEIITDPSKVRCYATEGDRGVGYDPDVFYESTLDAPNRRGPEGTKSYFSRILTGHISKILNIPLLKDHGSAGVSLSLKNLAFGSVNNTRRFHPSNCDPMISQVCAKSPIKEKLALNVVDGLIGCYNGGPGYKKQWVWPPNMLIFGIDPVAVDRVGLEIIEDKRKEMHIESIGTRAKHINSSATIGIGTAELTEIDWKKLT